MGALCCCCKFGGDGTQIVMPPKVMFDDRVKGPQVSISGRQQVISGAGIALATTSLQQDRAYFEFKVNKTGSGSFQVGVASKRANLDGELGDDSTLSWGFQSHAGIKDGDVIGVSYDQADMPNANFFHNGKLLENERLTGMRGEIVRGGAQLTANFGHVFEYEPPAQYKYSGIIPATSLIG